MSRGIAILTTWQKTVSTPSPCHHQGVNRRKPDSRKEGLLFRNESEGPWGGHESLWSRGRSLLSELVVTPGFRVPPSLSSVEQGWDTVSPLWQRKSGRTRCSFWDMTVLSFSSSAGCGRKQRSHQRWLNFSDGQRLQKHVSPTYQLENLPSWRWRNLNSTVGSMAGTITVDYVDQSKSRLLFLKNSCWEISGSEYYSSDR